MSLRHPVAPSCVCSDSITSVPWLIHMRDMTPNLWKEKKNSNKMLKVSPDVCAMTHLYVCQDLFPGGFSYKNERKEKRKCDMTRYLSEKSNTMLVTHSSLLEMMMYV